MSLVALRTLRPPQERPTIAPHDGDLLYDWKRGKVTALYFDGAFLSLKPTRRAVREVWSADRIGYTLLAKYIPGGSISVTGDVARYWNAFAREALYRAVLEALPEQCR